MSLYLYNTMGRKQQEFRPMTDGVVGMYACGPTVYNYAHIGNLRMYVGEDILRRTLEFLGYRVKHVMNITDVGHLTDDADEGEDKMEKSSRETGMTVWEISRFYTDSFFTDIARLNIEPPTVSCKATDHIPEMIDLVRRLEERGYTYQAGGNVYFDISKFPNYGQLAMLDLEKLQAGARIDVDENKKNPYDFVLWFTKSKFEHQSMQWDSPWGAGYPGWHLECSAMSMKYLGEQFDIHCGGIDHIPVHHTNEIAQSEGATGKKWVNYWIHGEFLLMDKGKMAKSAGNFLTLTSLTEKGYDPLDYRYFCLGGHYRSQLQFSFEAMDAARSARANCIERVREMAALAGLTSAETERTGADSAGKPDTAGTHGEGGTRGVTGEIPLPPPASRAALGHLSAFTAALEQDINMPKALSELWGTLKDTEIAPAERLAVVFMMDKVLGLNLRESALSNISDITMEGEGEILAMISEREESRKRKDFARADEIRAILEKRGIAIKDTPEGTKWKKL